MSSHIPRRISGAVVLAVVALYTPAARSFQDIPPSVCTPPLTRPDSRYAELANGAEVKDNLTGLIWQRCDVGMTWNGTTCTGSASAYTWQGAVDYAAATPASPSGSGADATWRLPSQNELLSLVDSSCTTPSLNRTWFPAASPSVHWASGASAPGNAYCAAFLQYGVAAGFPTDCFAANHFPLRLVRASGTLNQSPVARIRFVQGSATIPADTQIAVAADTSTDADGVVTLVAWDFGDGTPNGSPFATHTYQNPGRYTITLTATDNQRLSGSVKLPVTVSPVPTPTKVSATLNPVDSEAVQASANVAFTPTGDATGIVGYTATSSPGNLSATCTSSPCVVPGLTLGTAYTFTVTAQNAKRNSAASAASSEVRPLATPRRPRNLSAIGALENNTAGINVTYTAPESDGGSPITSYTVSWRATDSASLLHTPFTCEVNTQCRVTADGIVLGKSYQLFALATNAQGVGTRTAVIPVSLHRKPVVSEAIGGPADGTARLTFSSSVEGGSPTYRVSDAPTTASVSCTSSSCAVTNLVAGTSYSLSVTSNSLDGGSATSDPTEVVASAAPAPTGVSASATLSGVSVSFTAPTAGPGSTLTYEVTNNVDQSIVTCQSSPCVFLPNTGGTITYSVATRDTALRRISAAVPSGNTVRAAVFNTAGEATWSIPSGTTNLQVIAIGGGGGGGGVVTNHPNAGPGGSGAQGAATFNAQAIGNETRINIVTGAGGAGGGDAAIMGGGGGGASGIQLGTSFLVAGGGGGGGGQRYTALAGMNGSGGRGGNGGQGTRGENGSSGLYSGYGGYGGGQGPGDGNGGPCAFATMIAASGAGGRGGNGSGTGGAVGGSGVWAATNVTNGGDASSTGAQGCNMLEGGGGAGGGGYGGGGGGGPILSGGVGATGGGGGGSTGPADTSWSLAGNGGLASANGGRGRVIIFY